MQIKRLWLIGFAVWIMWALCGCLGIRTEMEPPPPRLTPVPPTVFATSTSTLAPTIPPASPTAMPQPSATATPTRPAATSLPMLGTATPVPPPASLVPPTAPPVPTTPVVRVVAGKPSPTLLASGDYTATALADIIVDNRDPGFTTAGSWFVGTAGAPYRGDCLWAPPGIGNIAYIAPNLPVAGSYEVLVWWPGDPNYDQAPWAEVQIHALRCRGPCVPYAVRVEPGFNGGMWRTLGIYWLEREASVSVASSPEGNTAVDAFRFLHRSSERVFVTPTPLPTRLPTSRPMESALLPDGRARRDLTQRLGSRTWGDAEAEAAAFDDCQTFPRAGCGGQRQGWRVRVRFQDVEVTYRVPAEGRYLALTPASEALARRQLLYLAGERGEAWLKVMRYPDGSWQLMTHAADGSGSQRPLEAQDGQFLLDLASRYATVTYVQPDGAAMTFYGLGQGVELAPADLNRLAAWVDAAAQHMW